MDRVNRRTTEFRWPAIALFVVFSAGTALAQKLETEKPRFPAVISRYDLATRDELLYAYWVSPFVEDNDVSKWSWITDLVYQVGTWAGGYIDANRIADAIHHGLPIEGQKPLTKLDSLVGDCAKVLGVSQTTVVVRNAPETQAYLVATEKENILV
jgi:hypothetical protein